MANTALYGGNTTANESNTGQQRILIEDFVVRYPRKEFILLNRWNGDIFKRPVDNVKYAWKEENIRADRDLLGVTISTTTGTTVIATTSGQFNQDDVLQVDSEQMICTGIATDGITMTVTRGWAGTTAATHATAATEYIYRIGIAAVEGTQPNNPLNQPMSDLFNYTQIFKDTVLVSGSEMSSWIYRTDDADDNASSQIIRVHRELAEMLNNALILGQASIDSTGLRRTTGGLKWFIDTFYPQNAFDMGGAAAWNTANSTTGLAANNITVAQQRLDDLIEQLVYNRSTPTALYANYRVMRRIREWGADKIRYNDKQRARGIMVPDQYISEAGDLDLIYIQGDALHDLIIVADETRVGYKPMQDRGWFTQKLGIDGDREQWQVIGEYIEKVETPKVHGYLYNLGLNP